MRDGLVLALDGSTGVCSTALLRLRELDTRVKDFRPVSAAWGDDGENLGNRGDVDPFEVLAGRSEGDGRAQAKLLLRLIHDMLEESGRRPEDLRAVVVGKGPGTFTGVRVTVATARALSLALAIPILGVSTIGALAAMAAEVAASSTIAREVTGQSPPLAELEAIVPVVDARRSQVFYGVYHPSSFGPQSEPCPWGRRDDLGVCDRAELGDILARRKTVIVGEEALRPEGLPATAYFLSKDFAAQYLVVGQKRLSEPGRLPEGRRLTEWLHRALTVEEFTAPEDPGESTRADPGTPESVVPIYIRSPDADVHITRMKDPWGDRSSEK